MRIFLFFVAIVVSSQTVSAFNDMELRDKWSQQVMAVKKVECEGEPVEVKKKLVYAASLIMHGEFVEARSSIKSAEGTSKTEICRKNIPKIMKPQ